MKKNRIIFLLIIMFSIAACDTYPDWNKYVEYSDVYPICGEYYVYDYEENGDILLDEAGDPTKAYILYIYNKAYNPTKDSIWLDNKIGHPSGAVIEYPYKYKIKCKADTNNLTFDCEKNGSVSGNNAYPLDSAVTVTIVQSKIIDNDPGDIESSLPDSIYFKFSYYDKFGELVKTVVTAGHRKTGWEEPNYDDPM